VQVVHAVEGKTATAGSCERLDSALAGGAGPPIFLCVLWHRQPAISLVTRADHASRGWRLGTGYKPIFAQFV